MNLGVALDYEKQLLVIECQRTWVIWKGVDELKNKASKERRDWRLELQSSKVPDYKVFVQSERWRCGQLLEEYQGEDYSQGVNPPGRSAWLSAAGIRIRVKRRGYGAKASRRGRGSG